MTPNIYRFICGSIAFTGLQGLANAATLSPLHYLTGRSVPDGVLVAPLTRIENNSAYGLEFQVGTPPQKNILKVDTGSSTIGFQNPDSNECKLPVKPCDELGSYNNATSSSSVFVSATGYNDALIDHASGRLVNDTLRFGSPAATFTNFMFGVRDVVGASYVIQAPDASILGLGQDCLDEKCNSYATLQQQLYERKVLANRAFGLYLGPDKNKATGTLIFSGYDSAKQGTGGFKLKVVNPASDIANNGPNTVNVTAYFTSFSDTRTSFPTTAGYVSLIDSGNPLWEFPRDVYAAVVEYFDLDLTKLAYMYGPPVADCKFRNATKDALRVAFSATQYITVTMDTLISELPDGSCAAFIGPGTNIGDPFLRSVYTIFDIDNHTISFSPVVHNATSTIVALPGVPHTED